MVENKASMLKKENKKDNVRAPWQEEMAPGDFVSFAPSYRAGKYFSLYEKYVFPCGTVGDITYYLYDPVKNGKDASKQYPLLVFFHGASNALDGELCINYCGGELYACETYQESMGGGAYILIPVANEKRMPDDRVIGGWSDDYIAPCMELIRKIKVEEKNVSKTVIFGNSKGGTFIWELLLNTPDEFDGFVPMGAGHTPCKEEIDLLKTKKVNLLLTHGRRDELTQFDKCLAYMEEELQKMENCICYFPEWVRNSDGGVASINFGIEMGQHCIVNAVHSNLIFDNGQAYDERLPEGVTGWIRSILND